MLMKRRTNTQLTENLNTILDNFQMVVGSGMTTSIYSSHPSIMEFNLYTGRTYENDEKKKYQKGSLDIDIQSDFDGLYPIDPKVSSYHSKDHHSKEVLIQHPVSNTDKKLLKEWFLSGGNVKNYQYGNYWDHLHIPYGNWWRFTKGLLWKFYNYLLVNLEDGNLKTIDERLSISLMDLIYDQTSKDSRFEKEELEPYKTLEERYGNPQTQKVEREIEELKKELERKEEELFNKEQKLRGSLCEEYLGL